ncbi:ABC transporter substrate-binding protein [Paenibacillus protaetiae]|uniref:Extracellular solute-binding protein n=1 Tax=Paenibacillus protaetiae TaxID=2509456 RepID=A0A4P6EUX7_9BACL|nr:extracellular solute-binding protein [Paenibacillus protaetiae]QAY65449.1 extracellular solute-binding protein [Paenibacillus protaetiae]
MEKGKQLGKWAAALVSVTLLAGVLSACSGGNDSSAEKRVLRIGVLYGSADNESYTRQQYTDTYEYTHKNIDIEIVSAIDYNDTRFETPDPNGVVKQPDPYEEMTKMLTGDNPVDVIIFGYDYLKRLTQDNMLKQLDPLIAQDKFDIADYVPTVIDGIKTAGDNNIYALTPSFSSSALYYNKSMFTEAGVDFPTDGMTWDQVFDLARLVSKGDGEERQFGLTMNRWGSDAYSDLMTYSAPLGLKKWDDKLEKMTVNEPGWQAVWEKIAGIYKDHISPTQEDMQAFYNKLNQPNGDGSYYYNPIGNDLFLNGRVAMTIGEYNYTNEIKTTMDNASKIKDFKPFEWDVVTPPTHAEAPGVGNVYLSDLMGINANAQNADDAWDFIKFTNSKEWAELKSRSMTELSARQEFIKPRDGLNFNIKAFTTLKPIPPQSVDLNKQYMENPRLYEAEQPAYNLFQEVLQGTKTVPEALAAWETEGNKILTDIKNNPTGSGVGIAKPGIRY